MKVGSKLFQSIWVDEVNPRIVKVIDQRELPFKFVVRELITTADYYEAIREMIVRGAPLIGVTAAFAIYSAALEIETNTKSITDLKKKADFIKTARQTAVNLEFAVNAQLDSIKDIKNFNEAATILFNNARNMLRTDIETNRKIGIFGVEVIEKLSKYKKGKTINILTHCNAGWLATVDYGTALAPIFEAKKRNIDIHVWVDETRPRNQGAKLTAWELFNEDVSHTVIPDNTGGHLMQNSFVDIVIVGTDRTSINGEVANKIGTYLKALAAYDNNIPFYVAAPSSSIDFHSKGRIPIEERAGKEVRFMDGLLDNDIKEIQIIPDYSPVANFAFDVTPAKFVTGLITERGICQAQRNEILKLFPEKIE